MAWTINLPRELDGFVERMIVSGRYGSVGDLVADALVLLEGMERETETMREGYRTQIADGLADMEAGRTHDVDDVFAEADEIIRRHEEKRDAAE